MTNLLLIVAGIGLVGLLHVAVGFFSLRRLLTSIDGGDVAHNLKTGLAAATFFALSMAFWLWLVFMLQSRNAPMPVFNFPAWILLVLHVLIRWACEGKTSAVAVGSHAIGVAVPASAVFASVYYERLSQIFGPINLH